MVDTTLMVGKTVLVTGGTGGRPAAGLADRRDPGRASAIEVGTQDAFE